MHAAGGTSGDEYTLEFAPPRGGILTAGTLYTDAERAYFRIGTHPGIYISGSGRGCNTATGQFADHYLHRDRLSGRTDRKRQC